MNYIWQLILIEVPENFDLVLEFASELSRENFLRWIDAFFTKSDPKTPFDDKVNKIEEKNESSLITISSDDTNLLHEKVLLAKRKLKLISYATRNEILKEAETKERRQEKLDQFFREAYALTFGVK